MGLSLVAGPALDPVSLAEAKAHCRVFISDDDGLIAGYVLAARQYVEEITRRAMISQTWDYTIDGDWPWIVDEGCRNFSISRGAYAGAALDRTRSGKNGMLSLWVMRSFKYAQNEMPSLRQVFFKLMKVSRQRRPTSLRVPPLTLRFFT